MRHAAIVLLALFLIGVGASFLGAQDVLPAGITCCDEQKIRQAMTEEALARILARSGSGGRPGGTESDYLTEQAYGKIKAHLSAANGHDQRLAFLRQALQPPPMDRDIEEFQMLVGHFVLGMTLEIGNTLQDEYDQALFHKEKLTRLVTEIEKSGGTGEKDLARFLSKAHLTAGELRRIRAIERKWKNAPAGAPPLSEFNTLKKNVTGHAADQDPWLVFQLSERYRSRFPFLDEFLENYRRLAEDFLQAARKVNERLSAYGS
jgi:hypothetical protein